jgi:hypothetical protein
MPFRAATTHARGRRTVWLPRVGSSRIADEVVRGPVAWRASATRHRRLPVGAFLWACGLRRGESKWAIWAAPAHARGRRMVWFPTAGSSRIADGVTRGPSAWRTDVGAISSAAGGPVLWVPVLWVSVLWVSVLWVSVLWVSVLWVSVLWAYASWRRGSKSLTGALVAGARGRRMAPAPRRRRTCGRAVAPAAGHKAALRCADAAESVGAGQGEVGSPPDDGRCPFSVALGGRVASASENILGAAAETSCIEGPGSLEIS